MASATICKGFFAEQGKITTDDGKAIELERKYTIVVTEATIRGIYRMRRKDREIVSHEELQIILAKCKVCRIAMIDNNKPYMVPLNYGYEYKDEIYTIYFHSNKEGRKVSILQDNPVVCFEVDCNHRLVEATHPCNYGYAYESIIGEGSVTVLCDVKEKIHALNVILMQQAGRTYNITAQEVEHVLVCKVTIHQISGKHRLMS